jgi:nicotinamide riboside transporter PnuC
MTRLLIQYLLPLILPAVIFLIWAWLSRHRHATGSLQSRLQEGPWLWLIVAGLVLMVGGLVYMALSTGGDAGGTYVAPRWEDGRIVPGRIE